MLLVTSSWRLDGFSGRSFILIFRSTLIYSDVSGLLLLLLLPLLPLLVLLVMCWCCYDCHCCCCYCHCWCCCCIGVTPHGGGMVWPSQAMSCCSV